MFEVTDRKVYSIRNSYLAVKKYKNFLAVINTHGWRGQPIVISIPCDDEKIFITPEKLSFHYQGRVHELTLYGKFGFILRGSGRMICKYFKKEDCFEYNGKSYDASHNMTVGDKLFINDYKNDAYLWVSAIRGKATFEEKWNDDDICVEELRIAIASDNADGYEVKFDSSYEYGNYCYQEDGVTFEKAVDAIAEDYAVWQEKYRGLTEECIYTLWGNQVGKHGILPTESCFAGNGGMWALWSWDNAFDALGRAGKFNDTAYNLFMLPYRMLLPNGYMFDSLTDTEADYRFTKPPVHGLIYSLMMEISDYFCQPSRLREVVEEMKRNTDNWLYHRGPEPCYIHGNDSGADNATCFDQCRYVATPELYAFLSVQCDTIADISKRLGDDCVEKYREYAEALARKTEAFIVGDKLSVKDMSTGKYIAGDSLLLYRTLVAGDKLSERMIELILKKLLSFETRYGFASEPITSAKYKEDGYWRGPVWAPDQVLLHYALRKIGKKEYAKEMALRYIEGIEKAGCYENIDGQKGVGYRCAQYGWTASAVAYFHYFYKNGGK